MPIESLAVQLSQCVDDVQYDLISTRTVIRPGYFSSYSVIVLFAVPIWVAPVQFTCQSCEAQGFVDHTTSR